MEKIVFNCETITPMFSAGADKATLELRVPEIKAALRFWWRACNGHLKIEKLKEEEAKIFGGSGEKEGKSSFSMRVTNIKDRIYDQATWDNDLLGTERNKKYMVKGTRNGIPIDINLFNYLGFGALVEYRREIQRRDKNVLSRKGYAPKTSFQLIVSYDKAYEREIFDSFKLLNCFGAIGAKSRNGFGRILFKPETTEIFDSNIDALFKGIKKQPNLASKPAFTAFSKEMSLFKTETSYDSWHKALFEIGKVYRESRLALPDHKKWDIRQYLASPIIVNKKDVTKLQLERHSKSYFMIISKADNGYSGHLLHLPYNFNIKHDKYEEYKDAYEKMNRNILTKMEEVEVIND